MAAKQLFLGGGAEGRIDELDSKFAELLLRTESKKLLYIPLAHPIITINGIEYNPDTLYVWAKRHFARFGINHIDLCRDFNEFSDITGYGAVYIGGGNTFDLMKKMQDSGFDKILDRYIDNGGIVYGSSAGAIVLGNDISVASMFGEDKDTDHVGSADKHGLDKVDGYTVICHYMGAEDEAIMDYVNESGSKIVALPSETGLYFDGEHMETVGKDDAYFFADGKKILIG